MSSEGLKQFLKSLEFHLGSTYLAGVGCGSTCAPAARSDQTHFLQAADDLISVVVDQTTLILHI